MAHGVLAGLGQGGDHRELAGPGAHVANDDDADGHAIAALDAADAFGDGGFERVGGLRVARVEPRAQFALLGEGDGAHAGGVFGGGTDEGEGLEHGIVQVSGDVCPLGFAHTLGLGLGQVLRGAHPQGAEGEEDTRDDGDSYEASAQQDDGWIVARRLHDDAEAQQRDTAHNGTDKAPGPPASYVATLAPHEGDTRNDRHDGTHVAPVQCARRVQDGACDRATEQGDADNNHAVA